jgi:hypothetical protein
MSRRLVALLSAAAAVLAAAAVVAGPAPSSAALTASEWQAGNIISDSEFYNSSTMSVAQIQSFLDKQVPACASGYTCLKDYSTRTSSHAAQAGICAAYTGRSSETSAAIFYNVGRACGINPQVLLVLVQKEQGLVQATMPSQYAYDFATGANCPDSTGCDASSKGFFNQVYLAAYQFRYYRLHPTFYNYIAGRNNSIQYNPNTSCGAGTVFIQNQATAGLYIYTPYQPNAAALANLHGTGDKCSAYGNRNFWVFFNEWFAPPSEPFDRGGMIATKPDGTLWYYRNGGTPTHPFSSAVQIGLSGWQHLSRLTSGDVDGDGRTDLIGVRPDGSLWLYRNNGTSLPYSGRTRIGAYGWNAFDTLVAADVDGDGRSDLIARTPSGQLWLYRNTGTVSSPYAPGIRIGASGWQAFRTLVAADVDGDGRSDLLGVKANGSLWLYHNGGAPTAPFRRAAQIGVSGWTGFRQLIAQDVDADGRADLIGSKSDGSLLLYRAGASITRPYSSRVTIGTSGWQAFDRLLSGATPVPRAQQSADLIAVRPDGSGTLWRYQAQPPTKIIPVRQMIGAYGWSAFDRTMLGDVDGDGRADLVATKPNGTLWLYRNTGSASHPYGHAVRIGAYGWNAFDRIALGDVDGDGRADLVARRPDGSLWLYRNGGSVTHPFGKRAMIGTSGWNIFDRILLADVTGDKRVDLIATSADGTQWLYPNRRSLSRPFSGRNQTGLAGRQDFSAMAAADFTGDGHADVLYRERNGVVSLAQDGGQSRWPDGIRVGLGNWNGYAQIMAGDVDGDGLADVVTIDSRGGLWLFPNTGAAAQPLLARTQIGVSGWNAFATVLQGDVDGNGVPDLVGVRTDGSLWLYLGVISATRPFPTRARIGLSGWTGFPRLVLGDFTGDGRPDLLGITAANAAWLYPNTGNMSEPFSYASRELVSAPGVRATDLLTAVDLNGDGMADLLAKRADGTAWVSLSRHVPDQPFAAPVPVATGWQGYDRIVAGDLDANGRADLVARDTAGALWLIRADGRGELTLHPRQRIGISGWQSFTLLAL